MDSKEQWRFNTDEREEETLDKEGQILFLALVLAA